MIGQETWCRQSRHPSLSNSLLQEDFLFLGLSKLWIQTQDFSMRRSKGATKAQGELFFKLSKKWRLTSRNNFAYLYGLKLTHGLEIRNDIWNINQGGCHVCQSYILCWGNAWGLNLTHGLEIRNDIWKFRDRSLIW